MTSHRTDPTLLAKIKAAATTSLPVAEVKAQRLSWAMSCIRPGSMTRDQVAALIR